jgi:hypothetical protein
MCSFVFLQDPAFDKIIKALYGDVDQFDAEVSALWGPDVCCVCQEGQTLGARCVLCMSKGLLAVYVKTNWVLCTATDVACCVCQEEPCVALAGCWMKLRFGTEHSVGHPAAAVTRKQ